MAYQYSLITGLSGALVAQIAVGDVSQATLNATGALITSLSGWAASRANLAATGTTVLGATNGVGTNLSGNLTQTGVSLVARDLAISGALAAQMTALVNPASFVTGNFAASGYNARYVWSGVATTWTGTLGTPTVLSGAEMIVTNIATGAPLFLTGNVFYGLNYTVQPRSSVTLWSVGATWLYI